MKSIKQKRLQTASLKSPLSDNQQVKQSPEKSRNINKSLVLGEVTPQPQSFKDYNAKITRVNATNDINNSNTIQGLNTISVAEGNEPKIIKNSSQAAQSNQFSENNGGVNKQLPSSQLKLHSLQPVNQQRQLYNSEIQGNSQNSYSEQKPKLDNRINQQFNTPLRGTQKQSDQNIANTVVKITTMSSFQLNQHQIKIEEQINSITDSIAEQQIRQEKIKVAVRVRPFIQKELGKENVCFVSKNSKQIRVSDVSHTVEGIYDKVFPIESSQADIYSYIADCIPSLLNGFNCTIFAYGQTGSGKTFTMFGEGGDQILKQSLLDSQGLRNSNDVFKTRHQSTNGPITNQIDAALESDALIQSKRGIIPRCISELFKQIKSLNIKVTIYCSFLQIYNEKLYDLLQDTYTKNPLQIREEKVQGIYVEGLSEYVVQDEFDCLNLLKRGERNRIKRSTKMNMQSSRSHSLFQMLLETDQVDGKGMLKRAKLNLGDLAGSEKINKDEQMKTKHMLELRNINLSLTTLGKVIQILSSSQTNPHVPFRESKLTRLLQDSLGGNCQTYLIATVSPLMDSIEETISTLKFANRAKCVMQRVKKNEINAKDDAVVQRLQKEVQYLKELLQLKRKGQNPQDLSHQLYQLRDENERLRQIAMNFEDVERMKQENKLMRLELQKLKMLASDGGSIVNGDVTPRTYQGAANRYNFPQNSQIEVESYILKNPALDNNSSTNIRPNERLSDSDDESIQEHFKNYKSELNFDIKLDNKSQSHHGGQQSIQTDLQTERSKLTIPNNMNNRYEGSPSSIQNHQDTHKLMQENLSRAREQQSLKAQKERLQNVIAEQQQQVRSFEIGIGSNNHQQTSTNIKSRHHVLVRKRYKEGDLSDEGGASIQDNVNITLPAISDAQISLQNNIDRAQFSKVEISRKGSNNDIFRINNTSQHLIQGQSHSPYLLNRSNLNPLMKSSETYLTDFSKPQQNVINKYPQRQNPNLRRSINEYPISTQNASQAAYQQQPSSLSHAQSEVNQSYQVAGSQGLVGMTTQSSLYGIQSQNFSHGFNQQVSHYSDSNQKQNSNHKKPPFPINSSMQLNLNQTTLDAAGADLSQLDTLQQNHSRSRDKSPLQTVVRIRGRHNQLMESKGSLMLTLDEEKRIQEKKRQLRRSNDRLRQLENMEQARKEKIEQELERLMKDKDKREQDEIKKREIIKQRKYVNTNVGVTLNDKASESDARSVQKLNLNQTQIKT